MAHDRRHLSSNLGTIELTIALHYVFDTPHDRIVWDVGHQTYAHKILTGRRQAMSLLRMAGGPSGFPRRSESPYDTFGTAHSSTSISAALGMAVAARRKGEDRAVVAVIGDGAMSAGMESRRSTTRRAGRRTLVILNETRCRSGPVGEFTNTRARCPAASTNYVGAAARNDLPAAPVKELAKRRESN